MKNNPIVAHNLASATSIAKAKTSLLMEDFIEYIELFKKEQEENMDIDHGIIYGALKEQFPKIDELKFYDKPEQKVFIIRIKYGEDWYDITLPLAQVQQYGNMNLGLFRDVRSFIEQEIIGKKKQPKKRKVTSKKQRDMKKAWML